MKNIFKFLSGAKQWVLVILCLLIVQAYCDLALPSYTSDLLNVGLQQGGIENGVLDIVREESLENLTLFMSEEDTEWIQEAYGEVDSEGIRTLKDDVDKEKVNTILKKPEAICFQLENMGNKDISLEKIRMAIEAGMMTKEQLQEMIKEKMSSMEASVEGMEDMTDMFLSQVAVQYVAKEYTEQGINMDQVRNAYLIKVGIRMLLMAFVMMVVAILTGLIASVVSARIGRDLREQIYSRVMSYTKAEMEKFSTASLITRATNDIQQIQMVTVILLRMVCYAPILAIGGIIKVVQTNVDMGWIIVVAVILLMALVFILVLIAMPKFRIMQSLVDRLNLVSREILSGIMPIRAFSREAHEEARFEEANNALYKTQLFTNRTMTFMMPIMMFIMNGISVTIVWIGGHHIDQGKLQIGDLTAFITYSMVIVMGFLMMSMVSILLPRAGIAADRIVEVLNTKPTLHDPAAPQDEKLKTAKGVLAFEDVSFRYPGAEADALEHISFTAEPGKTTAIIGSTGCGKTTLLNLIPRFFDVTDGKITLDGIDIRDLTQEKLHDFLGYVPQKGMLFSGTIETNLKYGGEHITDADMKEAAEIAQATDFISEKKDGYASAIAQGGTNVSGGQRQRLSIARAIARHPKIYLFDDSFSALDYKTDLTLRKALAEKTGDATVVIVAQRISTILHADQILVLDEGRIVGCGTHDELMKNCSTYQEIARSQLSDAELGTMPSDAEQEVVSFEGELGTMPSDAEQILSTPAATSDAEGHTAAEEDTRGGEE
ncbi:MAG: ABC transporter ATP-binding protein/permease [Lachnospiraceae bacterium]|nr:ABC transporter ATP-binding protein/permease [Lachnospiraceae bacterium]